MTNKDWQQWLKDHQACTEGYKIASKLTPQEWWDTTDRADWMIWVLRRTKYEFNWDFLLDFAKENYPVVKEIHIAALKAIELLDKPANVDDAAYTVYRMYQILPEFAGLIRKMIPVLEIPD